MTETTGKIKINDVAKAVAKNANDHLRAVKDVQDHLRAQTDSLRKLEAELLRKAREQQAQETARPEEAASEARKPEAALQTPVQQPQEKAEPVKAEKPAAQPAAEKEEKPTTEASEPVQEEVKQPKTEKTAEPAPAAQQAPKPRFERPAERLARRQGGVLRDDAAARNAQRMRENPPAQNRQQRTGDRTGRPQQQGARPQRPMGDRPQHQDQRNNNNNRGGMNRPRPMTPAAPPMEKGRVSNYDPKKSSYTRVFDSDKRQKSKKQLEKERYAKQGGIDEVIRGRRPRKRQQPAAPKIEPIKIDKAVITGDTVSVKTLAERIGKPATEIIKKLMMLNIIATINHEIDFDTAFLVASEFGVELEQKIEQSAEDQLISENDTVDDEKDLVKRPPVVTIMGHVDHGKTSLLDAIRSSRVTAGEAGGITQHIGAYTVDVNGESITFLDTPGHEAFTAMRSRGAQVTDVVILVVAADDGIMPQTIEAINHAKAANVPIIVAVNKIDLPDANPDRVKQELTEHGLVCEDWGGDTIVVPVSARTHEGLDTLLEMVLLVAEVQDLKANPNRLAKGAIVEAKLDKGRGPVATVLIENGTLEVGQTVIAGMASGRIKAMLNDRGQRVQKATPSMPVEVLGFDIVPEAGETMYAVETSALTRQIVEERKNRVKIERTKATSKVSLDDLFDQINEGQIKELNIIVKADVQGSVEAVQSSLEKLSNDEVRVKCIHGGVGAISSTDILLASASNAIVIGFNVRPDATARTQAEKDGVDIRLYRIIYQAIEDIENAMKGMLEPVYEEVILGHAEIRETFKVSAVGTIAGCMVQDGKMQRNCDVRLLRDNVVVYEGHLASLKRFKDDVKEVASGFECGLSLENFNDIKVGDVVEAYTQEEVKR